MDLFFVLLSGAALVIAVLLGTVTGVFSASAEDRLDGDGAGRGFATEVVPGMLSAVQHGGEVPGPGLCPSGAAPAVATTPAAHGPDGCAACHRAGDYSYWVSTGSKRAPSP